MTTLSQALSKNLNATLFALAAALTAPVLGACGDDDTGGKDHSHDGDEDAGFQHSSKFRFFVTSDTSKTGKLGGLKGADARCTTLAKAVGADDHTWHAYLSAEHEDGGSGGAVNARDRIGKGPWYN